MAAAIAAGIGASEWSTKWSGMKIVENPRSSIRFACAAKSSAERAAFAMTPNRNVCPTLTTLLAVRLQQPQPDLADRRERRNRVPQPIQRHLTGNSDRRGVEQLLYVGPGERRTDKNAAVLVDDDPAGAFVVVAANVRTGHTTGRIVDDADVREALLGLGLGHPPRSAWRVGDRAPRDLAARRLVAYVLAED